MALITTTGVKVTLDETSGLQNASATSTPAGDADDNDTSLTLPTLFSGRLTTLLAATTEAETLIGTALSGYDGLNTGLNAFTIAPSGGGTITDVRFTDSTGALLNGLDSGLDTAGGVSIYLYTDTTNNNLLLGRAAASDGSADPNGAIVFAAYIEETGSPATGGKIWTVLYQPFQHGDPGNPDDSVDLLNKVFIGTTQDAEFSLANAPSGQNLFLMFTTANPTVVDGRIEGVSIIATGKNPADQSSGVNITTGDTINTSQAGGPTTFGTNNQMITEQEGIRFTFVTGAKQDFTIPNLDQNEADVEANIDFTAVFGARTATFDVVQLQSGKSAQVKITALSTAAETGVDFINGYANDSTVAITNVRVINIATGLVVESSDGVFNDPAIAITFAAGVATVTGVKAGYKIEYTTAADHNRVLIENGGALGAKGNDHADFDIGGFKLLQLTTATAEIGSRIYFEDDGPSISTTGTEPVLTVDETVLATNDTKGFAANFSSAFGADGAGTLTYALGVVAGASGLTDTATGEAVHLSLTAGGVVEGRTATTNLLVFTVSVAANGDVTLDQLRAVLHPDTTNPDDSKSLTSDDLVTLTATKTDKDGDSAQATLNIGQNLNFKDDGPSISTTGTEPMLTVDETVLATNDTKGFAANFSSAFGADSAGTLTYALGVVAGASGLTDTATGEAVHLSLNGGVVEGRTATTNLLVFTVSVAANGDVTLDQLRAVVHPDTTNPDDSKSLTSDDLVTLTATKTDKDGDSAQATLNIGQNLNFKDDGPGITVSVVAPADALTVDETDLATNASASFADNFGNVPNYGADGAGTVSSAYALSVKSAGVDSGLVDVASNEAVLLRVNASGVVEGYITTGDAVVFTVSVDAAGLVSLDQIRALKHPDGTNPDDAVSPSAADLISLTRTDTITDKDGDTNTGFATLNIGNALSFEDDGPSITVSVVAPADALMVDETDLATNASASFADNFGNVPNYGADGAGTVSSAYALSVKSAGVDSGLVDVASNEAVLLTVNGAGVVEGRTATGDAVVFTVSVDAAGLVSLDQIRALKHPDGTNPDDAVSPSAADLISLTRTDTITDKDGDSNTGFATLNIGNALSFKDDGPSISTTGTEPVLTVDETVLATNDMKGFAANFSSAFGADGAGTLTYALGVVAGASGLTDTATGEAVHLSLTAGGVVEGRTATTNLLVFTVSVAANGDVTLDQLRAVLHPDTTNPDDSKSLTSDDLVTLTATKTDKDGDSAQATLNIGQNLNFEDDGPTVLMKSDLVYANTSNPTPGGTGIFDYAIGADARLTFSASNSDFSAITLTGMVGSTAISSPTVTWFSEDASTAVFTVEFNYQPDPASATTTAATGTLTFDKVNDTYTVALAQPVSGYTTLTTGAALGFTGYTAGTSTIDQTQPDVSVAKLSNDFFVQFTGASEPGGGTGDNNLQAVGVDLGTNFVNGELFTQAATWVSVSNTANGVAGDTIQKGEVLDLDFFNTNPTGFTSLTPTAQASGIFLKFDGIGSEDLVLVLKLVDPDDQSRITKAIIIDNSDILKFGSTIPTGYNIVLDNNDGAVIIESNDFNAAGENYLIEGAQLLVSTEGVTGTAINLNAATGSSGGSTTFQEFQGTPGTANPEAATTDNDVIKISDIGFVTANSATLNTSLSFDVSLVDADGDATATQTLGVSIVGGAGLSPTSGADTFAFTDADTDGLLAAVMYNVTSGFASGTDKLDFSAAGSVTNYAENLVAAANVSAFATAADTALNGTVQYYFGVVGSDGYLATDTDGDGITSIVKLAGVTDMAFSDII